MNIIVCEPGKPPEQRSVEAHADNLKPLYNIVGCSYFDFATFRPVNGTTILCDEAGQLKRLPPNRFGLVGTLVIAAMRRDRIDSLTDKQAADVLRHLRLYDVQKPPALQRLSSLDGQRKFNARKGLP